MEDIGRKDIIKTIRSYAVILLLHLIKQQAENRTTRSWDVSIRNSILEIQEENQRPKSAGFYLTQEELQEILQKAYRQALNKASLEVAEGRYEVRELENLVNQVELLEKAMSLISYDEELSAIRSPEKSQGKPKGAGGLDSKPFGVATKAVQITSEMSGLSPGDLDSWELPPKVRGISPRVRLIINLVKRAARSR